MAYLLHQGATITCMHAGQVNAVTTDLRVKVSQQLVTTVANNPYSVAGCVNPPPNANTGPCLTAVFASPATRVFASRQPVLTSDSTATCAPTGTGVNILVTQTRVKVK
jgi:hypothetical protein